METQTNASAAGTLRLGGDLPVHRLGFGGMRLTGPGVWGPPADPENALAVLRRALELGITFFDTAEAYGPQVNEEQIASALYPYRDGLVIGTKGGSTRSGPGQWGRDGRPEKLRADCEGSLRRLRLDRIDLWQLHAVDPSIPYAEQIGTVKTLQDEGKIRHIGISNVTVEQLRTAQSVARIVSVQNQYNVLNRHSEDVLEICEREDIAFIPWFPLGAGDVNEAVAFERVAKSKGITPFQLAIAWLLKRSPVMLPIPGTSSLDHLEDNVAAASFNLTDAEFASLAGL
ncbi:MAG: aldo/keto reductase [Candidatus Eremiobacteraeota bacterium]|nr:aldo/keto reductase [Candidatus Eremiobacteraeota bacterium]